MSVTITATDHGYHLLTATGRTFAPTVLLKDQLNTSGRVNLSLDDGKWTSPLAGDAGLILELHGADVFEQAQNGTQTTTSFSSATLYRMENGERVAIAEIDFGTDLYVTATADVQNDAPIWYVDIANAFTDLLETDGFKFVGGHGDDIFNPTETVFYPTHPTSVSLGGGDDTAIGTHGDDSIRGGRGDDTISDDSGANILRGGKGNDVITVGDNSTGSILRGGSGNDHLTSGKGHDTLNGGKGDDHMVGGAGDDRLRGGDGNDYLNGGWGNDKLTGGKGADVFEFNHHADGHNVITDFEIGTDQIYLPANGWDFDELTLTQIGNKTVVTANGDDFSITLRNIDATDLSADEFIFG